MSQPQQFQFHGLRRRGNCRPGSSRRCSASRCREAWPRVLPPEPVRHRIRGTMPPQQRSGCRPTHLCSGVQAAYAQVGKGLFAKPASLIQQLEFGTRACIMTPWCAPRNAALGAAVDLTAEKGRGLSSLARIGGQTTPLYGEAYLTIASRRRGSRMVIAATLVPPPLLPCCPLLVLCGVRAAHSACRPPTRSSAVQIQAAVEQAPHAVEALLDEELPSLPELELGQLDNGLRYVILPNKVPADRFEAHLEIHAGVLSAPYYNGGPLSHSFALHVLSSKV